MSEEKLITDVTINEMHFETKEEHLLKQVLANQKLLLTTFIKFFDQKNDDWTEKERNKMTKLYRKAIEATAELLED